MSYMKAHLAEQAERNALRDLVEHMHTTEAENRRQRLERLAWEAQRSMQDYLAALAEYESDCNDDAGRRADETLAAGSRPF